MTIMQPTAMQPPAVSPLIQRLAVGRLAVPGVLDRHALQRTHEKLSHRPGLPMLGRLLRRMAYTTPSTGGWMLARSERSLGPGSTSAADVDAAADTSAVTMAASDRGAAGTSVAGGQPNAFVAEHGVRQASSITVPSAYVAPGLAHAPWAIETSWAVARLAEPSGSPLPSVPIETPPAASEASADAGGSPSPAVAATAGPGVAGQMVLPLQRHAAAPRVPTMVNHGIPPVSDPAWVARRAGPAAMASVMERPLTLAAAIGIGGAGGAIAGTGLAGRRVLPLQRHVAAPRVPTSAGDSPAAGASLATSAAPVPLQVMRKASKERVASAMGRGDALDDGVTAIVRPGPSAVHGDSWAMPFAIVQPASDVPLQRQSSGPLVHVTERRGSGPTAPAVLPLLLRKPDQNAPVTGEAQTPTAQDAGPTMWVPQVGGAFATPDAYAQSQVAVHAGAVDVDWIADRVERRLARRLDVERDRLGVRSWR